MENTQAPAPAPAPAPTNKRAILVGIIAIVVVAILAVATFIIKSNYKPEVKPPVAPPVKVVKVPTGNLLLSMVPKEVTGGMALTYTVDIAKGIHTPLFQYLKESDKVYIFHTSLSPDFKKYVTGGTPSDVDPNKAIDAVGLYSGVFSGKITGVKDAGPISKFGGNAESKGLVLRLPSISNNGAIVYSTPSKSSKGVGYDWEIHYSMYGNDYQVAAGLAPHFVSDSSFVYLSSRGLRENNVIDGTDASIDSIIDNTGKVVSMQPNMMMNVSRDGNQIALSNPEEHKVYLYKKINGKYIKNKEFSAFGFWPTFSPDGKILALQTVRDLKNLKTNPEAKVVFWDIEENIPELIPKEIDLSNYQNALLFINDWY